ncbi:hypothetical protein Cme02nite_30430 [Catellatospora methionotrophica]|uniref:DUF664 domain-containing protein n=1 Tax=Catellatospora methionotrophica TaxID=121620 RepID=A0A8J3PGV3_9ACTN|nr:DUF664 domain-containing protein [Catellatospora methionotrophica]GIG14711.1 hypothetical protein Cme02nite_30430 [Catellatospora methionotrophica]
MTDSPPSPTAPYGSRNEVFAAYLDYYRADLITTVERLPEAELRRSRLASRWTPVELLKHLRHVELRWIVWGFEGQDVGYPWGDQRDGRWHVDPTESLTELVAVLRAQGEHTREVVLATDLSTVGQPGERWEGADPATLERVLFHLLQEYARHAGHLDVVAELAAADDPA